MSDAEILPRKCLICGQTVDSDDSGTVTAYEQVSVPTFGQSHDRADGFKYDFHAACFPDGSPGWRRSG